VTHGQVLALPFVRRSRAPITAGLGLPTRRRGRILAVVASLLVTVAFGGIATAPIARANGLMIGNGFDTCAAPSTDSMASLRTSFNFIGIYTTGRTRACPTQTYINASWISTQLGRGWHFIPLQSDLQAPCNGGFTLSNRMSMDANTARSQGVSAADEAIRVDGPLGFGPSGIIYYDLEGFGAVPGACFDAVRAFFEGWTVELHNRSYTGGIYGSTNSSGMNMFASSNPPPDYVFFAEQGTNPDTNSGGMNAINPGYWTGHQRVKQWRGSHPDSRIPSFDGGVLDNDCANSTMDGNINATYSCSNPD